MKKSDSVNIYESPDRGKTVYVRQSGDTFRQLHGVDPLYKKEQALVDRWFRLKEAVLMDDPSINDELSKIEMLLILKRNKNDRHSN